MKISYNKIMICEMMQSRIYSGLSVSQIIYVFVWYQISSISLHYYFLSDLVVICTFYIIESMIIHVSILHLRTSYTYEMRNTDTVRDVIKKVQKDIGVSTTVKLVLISGGVELKDDCLLCHCSAHCEQSTLQVMLPMTSMYSTTFVVYSSIFFLALQLFL